MILWSKKYYPETYAPDDFYEQILNDKEKLILTIIKNNKEKA